jgi:hypothetical protein
MSYKYNNKNSAGRNYTNWTSNRGSSKQKLQALPPITNTANGKRYYSSIDAELYFGDIFIDEITSVAWNIQQQTIPLYGYNSYTFDDIAVGSRIIQGQFAINFTERNFLTKIQSSSSFQKIARRMYGKDTPVKDTDSGKIYSDFRQRLHLPMWDTGFDIVIGFGESEAQAKSGGSNVYSTFLVLNCVQITGSTIQLDYDGNPIQEVYTFMARDVKDTFSDSTEADPSSLTSENLVSSANGSKENLQLTGSIDVTSSKGKVSIVSSSADITFKEGAKLQLSGSFVDSYLGIQLDLIADRNTFSCNLSSDYVDAFKKKCGANTQVKGTIKCTYVNNASGSASKGQLVDANNIVVNFSIKK